MKVMMSWLMLIFLCLSSFNLWAAAAKDKDKELSKESRERLLVIFSLNEKLHKNFFDYDAQSIEKVAGKIAAKIEDLDDPKLKKLLEFSRETLKKMGGNLSREKNNEHYHRVSMAFLYLIKTYDIGDTYAGYRCPMVEKKWVQNTENTDKVLNPYAPQMKHCGSKLTKE